MAHVPNVQTRPLRFHIDRADVAATEGEQVLNACTPQGLCNDLSAVHNWSFKAGKVSTRAAGSKDAGQRNL